MSDLTDQEMFDAAISREPRIEAAPVVAEPTPEAQPAPTPEASPVARDEKGRFVDAKVETVAEPEQPSAVKEPAIPPSRLREEAEARRRADQENADLRARIRLLEEARNPPQPATPPDIFTSPEEWANQQIDPVRNQVMEVNEFWSRRFAEKEHGADKVAEAYTALSDAITSGKINGPQALAELKKSQDPYGDIVGWHQRNSLLSEIGSDPKAYEQKIIERHLSDPATRAKLLEALNAQQPATPAPAAQGGTSVVKLPPSLNRMTSAASSTPGAPQDVSDEALFSQTVARRR